MSPAHREFCIFVASPEGSDAWIAPAGVSHGQPAHTVPQFADPLHTRQNPGGSPTAARPSPAVSIQATHGVANPIRLPVCGLPDASFVKVTVPALFIPRGANRLVNSTPTVQDCPGASGIPVQVSVPGNVGVKNHMKPALPLIDTLVITVLVPVPSVGELLVKV